MILAPPVARPRPAGARDEGKRGTYASSTAAAIAKPAPTQSTLGSTRDVERADGESRRITGNNRDQSGRASATPSTAPAPQRTRLSASSVRRSAPGPAPSAARTASSPSRRTERARIRLATFEHAMTNTSAGRAKQHEQNRSRGGRDLIAELRYASG